MKTVGIIAEFNPFHNGHKYLIETARKTTNADNVVVICSGNYVQRGMPAVFDKTLRAKMAVLNGADAVFELPVCYSTASAELFATASVAFLSKLNCIDYLCFGCETTNTKMLELIASILANEPEEYKTYLSKQLKTGVSFPTARLYALKNYLDFSCILADNNEIANILSTPNNILAIEYLKAMKKLNTSIEPVFIQRIGAGYHSTILKADFASATGIRQEIMSNHINSIRKFIPENTHAFLKDNKFIIPEDFNKIVGYKLISENDFEKYYDITQFLSNRITKLKYTFMDINSFISTLHSKNYTFSRISRGLCHIVLEITKEDMEQFIQNNFIFYGRLLGFHKKSNILSLIKKNSTIDIIGKFSDYYNHCDILSKKMLDINLQADSLYRMVFMNKYKIELPTEFEREIFIL
ncbi:nucleotidyltransferase [uncultured Eubacterium sp.]|uniref:nucleotidyltransferase n=1 Tax=uncultured Eubacterium sp. TaxID=165185 RepID=UPI002672E1C2|nr:nucleotidyltransferase [uncultured Eubacterium sp.]